MSAVRFRRLPSPIGPLTLVGEADVLSRIVFPCEDRPAAVAMAASEDPNGFAVAATQLAEYFDGQRLEFSLQMAPQGTPFQRQVWEALQAIPYGETESYAGLARRIGRARAVRAVGSANGRNPLPLVIPCHRVIGADGSLTGFAGGLGIKAWLLRHEARTLGRESPAQAALF